MATLLNLLSTRTYVYKLVLFPMGNGVKENLICTGVDEGPVP